MNSFDRVNGRIDIGNGIQNGTMFIDELEQEGAARPKFWLNDYNYLFKEIYKNTHEDYGELLAYELAQIFGFECAEYDLAVYNGKRGVLTKNFVDEENGEEMISGTRIINDVFNQHIVPLLNAKKEFDLLKRLVEGINSDTNLQELYDSLHNIIEQCNVKVKFEDNDNLLGKIYKYYYVLDELTTMYNEDFNELQNGIIKSNNLYDIWNVLELYAKLNNYNIDLEKEFEKLIYMYFFDILISNGDRHAGNWSIIIDTNRNIRVAPFYDNSAFCHLNREKAIGNIYNYTNTLMNENYLERKKKKIRELLKSTIYHSNSAIKTNYENIIDKSKNDAIFQNFVDDSFSDYISKIDSFLDLIDETSIEGMFQNILNKTGVPVPDQIKVIVKTVLLFNINMMKQIIKGEYTNDNANVL